MKKVHPVNIVSMRWPLISLVGLFMLLALVVRLFHPSAPWVLDLVEALFFVVFLIYFIRGNYLVTTSDGLEYHRRDFVITAKWDDIDRVETLPQGYGSGESLILRRSILTVKQKDLIWLTHPEHVSKIIPLAAFSQPWRESELGKEIRKYAPHIFSPDAQIHKAA